MPQIAYTTHFLEDGTINPDVPADTLAVTGSGLPPNANITIGVSYDVNSKSIVTQTDVNGNLNFSITLANAILKTLLLHLGAGGGWNDNATRWIQPFTLANKNFLFSIEITP